MGSINIIFKNDNTPFFMEHFPNNDLNNQEGLELLFQRIINKNIIAFENLDFKASIPLNRFSQKSKKFQITISHENSLTLSNLLFHIFWKYSEQIDNIEQLPNINKLKSSFNIRKRLNESQEVSTAELIELHKKGKLFIKEYYNSSKENLLVKLWKNTNKHIGFIKYVQKHESEEEFFRLCLKLCNSQGHKIFLEQRLSLLKDNYYFIKHYKDNPKILVDICEYTLNSSIKLGEKCEILNNICDFIKKHKITIPSAIIGNKIAQSLIRSLQNHRYNDKLKITLLKVVRIIKPATTESGWLTIKLALFPEQMIKSKIDSIPKLLAYHQHYNNLGLDDFIDKFNIDEEFFINNKDTLYSNIRNINLSHKFSNRLFTKLLEMGLNPPLEDLYQIIKSNKNLLNDSTFIDWYYSSVKKNPTIHRTYLMKSNRRYSFLFQKFSSPYWFVNNGVLDFSPWTGNKQFDLLEIKYSKAFEYGSPENMFKERNIKHKSVKKAIYENLWDDMECSLNTNMLNNLLSLQRIADFDEQKLLPLINSPNVIEIPIDSSKTIMERFNISKDKYLNTLLKTQELFIAKCIAPSQLEHFMVDTCRMLNELDTILSEDRDSRKLFVQEGLSKIKKDYKDFKELHDMVARLSTKVGQEDFELFQDDIAEFNGDTFKEGETTYEILVPKTNHELIDAGERLHICVGGGYYAKQVRSGNMLIFLVKKENELVACIELDKNRKIRQSKSHHNSQFREIFSQVGKHPLVTQPKNKIA